MVPPGLPPYLQSLSKEHEVIHKKERFPASTADDVWIQELAKDGHWNIITIDVAIASTPHLAKVLEDAGHTAFFLTAGWSNLRREDLSWKYPKAWWVIVATASKPVSKGTWFTLGPRSSKAKIHARRA